MKKLLMALIATAFVSHAAFADVCDHRPSKLIAGKAVSTAAGGTAVAGVGMKAAGFYTLVHSASGATMLASTAAGSSAAGTVGIIGGTAGVVGSVGAFLMSPVVIGGALVVATGAAVYEGGCYLHSQTT